VVDFGSTFSDFIAVAAFSAFVGLFMTVECGKATERVRGGATVSSFLVCYDLPYMFTCGNGP